MAAASRTRPPRLLRRGRDGDRTRRTHPGTPPEFALLRLVGASRALVLRMLAAETALTAAAGIAAGTAIAWAAASAFGATLPGAPGPTVDAGAYAIVAAGALGLTAVGVAGGAVGALRGSAVAGAPEGTDDDG
ncbi:FtsX-like permease family protein [Yinghuangia aomiensis]